MSDQSIGAEDAVGAKRRKLSEQNQNQAVPEVAVVEAQDPPPEIFKLNIDCYEAVADWLSLKDLHSFGQTCTRHQQAAGYIFKEVYPAANVRCKKDGIYIGDVQVNGFCDYIRRLEIVKGDVDCFRFIESHSFALLKRITLIRINLTDKKIACIKKVLKKVEIVQLIRCKLDGDFHDKFLQVCESMKQLTVRPREKDLDHESPPIVIGASNDWLLREYPKLEHFEFTRQDNSYEAEREELKMFLQRNPNIRYFATHAGLFWEAKGDVRTKLDVLAIQCDDFSDSSHCATILRHYSKLNETKCFFKRLYIYSRGIKGRRSLRHLNSLKQTEKLSMIACFSSFSPRNLKEIHVDCVYLRLRQCLGGECLRIDLGTAIVNGNPDLERVSLPWNAKIEDVLALIRGSPKLTKLKIHWCGSWVRNERILDLSAWNEERAKLNRARKLTIYVYEKLFLATKWATHKTEYSLIRLERHESHDWNLDFKNF